MSDLLEKAKPMPDCELVIFDCDGTLMDSEVIASQVETEIINEYGAKLTVEEFGKRFAGTSTQYVRQVMEEELGRHFPDDHDATVEKAMLERLWREVKPVAGAVAVLDMFDQPRCVCSNASMEKVKLELTRAELWDRFRPYVFSAKDMDDIQSKPAPDLFLHAAKEFGVEPATCLVVEDSVSGVQAGVAAGMRTIGFTGGSHTHSGHADQLTEAGAETVLNKLTDVPAVIAILGEWDGPLA
ncbi:MAG: HAD family hydrolase [Pseudomonadota bacterium]